MYSIQLTHPFGLVVSGSTKSGKTTFVKKLLSYVNVMIDNPPENIVYFYAEYQDTFGEIQNLVPGIKFVQGLPDDILDSINPETRNLYVIDDFMGEKDGVISKLFTKKSHGNLSVIYIVQILFHHCKEHRTISLNASNKKRARRKSNYSSCQAIVPKQYKIFSTSLSTGNQRSLFLSICRLNSYVS